MSFAFYDPFDRQTWSGFDDNDSDEAVLSNEAKAEELARLQAQNEERERLEQEAALAEQQARQKKEAALAEQRARREQAKLEQVRREQEAALAKEQAQREQARLEQVRREQVQREQERLEQERLEQVRLEQEAALAAQQAQREQARLEQVRLEQEAALAEQERLEQLRREQVRREQEAALAEQERLDQVRREQEAAMAEQARLAQVRREQEAVIAKRERLDQVRREQEAALVEQERLEQVRREQEAVIAKRERLDQVRREQEAALVEQERLEQVRREQEAALAETERLANLQTQAEERARIQNDTVLQKELTSLTDKMKAAVATVTQIMDNESANPVDIERALIAIRVTSTKVMQKAQQLSVSSFLQEDYKYLTDQEEALHRRLVLQRNVIKLLSALKATNLPVVSRIVSERCRIHLVQKLYVDYTAPWSQSDVKEMKLVLDTLKRVQTNPKTKGNFGFDPYAKPNSNSAVQANARVFFAIYQLIEKHLIEYVPEAGATSSLEYSLLSSMIANSEDEHDITTLAIDLIGQALDSVISLATAVTAGEMIASVHEQLASIGHTTLGRHQEKSFTQACLSLVANASDTEIKQLLESMRQDLTAGILPSTTKQFVCRKCIERYTQISETAALNVGEILIEYF
jgi:myosin heavy subunit